MKDFGGGTIKGTLNAMIEAYHTYSSNDSLTKQLACAVADRDPVNFGCHTRASTKLSELVAWELPSLQRMNHKLELAMKDSYTGDHTFVKIKEMPDVPFRLFKIAKGHDVFTNELQKHLILFQHVSHLLVEQDFNLTHYQHCQVS